MTSQQIANAAFKFQVGIVYGVRSTCDHNCIYQYRVDRRTAKSVWLVQQHPHGGDLQGAKPKRRAIKYYKWSDAECCDPEGVYSMSPVLTADKDQYGDRPCP